MTIYELPANSTDVAKILGISVKQAGPIRIEIMNKRVAYSSGRGLITFTVPGFKEFIQLTDPFKNLKRMNRS